MKSLYEPHVNLISKVMDMQLQRQNVIMSNIANVNTPKYQTRTVEFEDQLQKALGLDMTGRMSRTEQGHMPATFDVNSFNADWDKTIKPRVVHGEDRVNLEKETTKMVKNSLQYNALTQVIKSNLDGVRNIIAEGTKV
ncbi:MAG: flagellar basal body rod protein FlgB [Bilophila sp.]